MSWSVLVSLFACGLQLFSASIQEFKLPNGLKVVLSENHERPLVRLEMRTPWNRAEEAHGEEGFAGFLGHLLAEDGTRSFKSTSLQQFLGDWAIHYSFASRPGAFSWSMIADSQSQDAAFQAMAMVVSRLELDEQDVEAKRQEFVAPLKGQTPIQQAEDRFYRGVGEPGHLLQPTAAALNRMDASTLKNFMRRIVRPETSTLVIVGDVNFAQAKQLTLLHLGVWGPSLDPPSASSSLPVGLDQNPKIWIKEEAGKPLVIRAGAPGIGSGPVVRSEIAGRLLKTDMDTARPPRALANVEFSFFANGAWLVNALAKPGISATEAMNAVQDILSQLRGKRIEGKELADCLQGWRRNKMTLSLHPQQEAEWLARNEGESAEDLTAENMQSFIRDTFRPETILYFVSGGKPGDAEKLENTGFRPTERVP